MSESCELLLDGLMACTSDLETHLIETLISRQALEHKVDTLQLAVLSFKTSFLKVLADGLGWVTGQANSSWLAPLVDRLQELQHRRCVLHLRNLVRGKVQQELSSLNQSAVGMTPDKLRTEESRIEQLAQSVVRMEKDLGIDEADRSCFVRSSHSFSQHEFLTHLEDSDQDAPDAPDKHSFLTSLSVHKPIHNRRIVIFAGSLLQWTQRNSSTSQLASAFAAIKQASQRCTCHVPLPQTPGGLQNSTKQPKASSKSSRQSTETMKQLSRDRKNDPKRQLTKKVAASSSVFHNILKQTYESLKQA